MKSVGNEITINHATAEEIRKHLLRCSDSFKPSLSSRVDIDAYSEKLSGKAVTFESLADGELNGLVAAYFSETALNEAFITNVSVTPEYSGKGVATDLMKTCIDYAMKHNFASIALEVAEINRRAVKFYEKLGFVTASNIDGQMRMRLSLENDRIL